MTLRRSPRPNAPPRIAIGLNDEVPTPSSYIAIWSEPDRSSASKVRQTLVRQTFAAELPVPSDNKTIFRLMGCPPRGTKRLCNLWYQSIACPFRTAKAFLIFGEWAPNNKAAGAAALLDRIAAPF